MNTVAQSTIDMNNCTDVLYSDGITDQKHTLVIHASDKYYLKGENREDVMGFVMLLNYIFK